MITSFWSGGTYKIPPVAQNIRTSATDICRTERSQPCEDIEEHFPGEQFRPTEDIREEMQERTGNISRSRGITSYSGEIDQGVDCAVQIHRDTNLIGTDQPEHFNKLGWPIQEDQTGQVDSNRTEVETVLDETCDFTTCCIYFQNC